MPTLLVELPDGTMALIHDRRFVASVTVNGFTFTTTIYGRNATVAEANAAAAYGAERVVVRSELRN